MSQSHPLHEVRREDDGYWEWLTTAEPPPYAVTGKYLFFSPDRDHLITIALEELGSGAFHRAKTQMPGKKYGDDYTLCLFYCDDSRKRRACGQVPGPRRRAISLLEDRRGDAEGRVFGAIPPVTRPGDTATVHRRALNGTF